MCAIFHSNDRSNACIFRVFREFAIQFPRYADDITKEQEAEKAPINISPKIEPLGEKLIHTTAKSVQAKRELSE